MKVIRLKNGQMIVGEISEEGKFTIITNPLFVVVTDQDYKFVDVLKSLSSDNFIKIESSEILYSSNPNEKVTNYHLLTFSEKSKIKTPPKKKLIV
jgi:hypothetical protein